MRRLEWLLFLSSCLTLARPSPAQDTEIYVVRPEESRFEIRVGKAGLFSVFGHEHLIEVRRFSGEVRFIASAPNESSVSLELDAASLTVVDPEVKADERAKVQAQMEAEALEVVKFPTIRFVSKKLSLTEIQGELDGEVNGDLTLKEVTRSLKIPLRIAVAVGKLGARGRFKLKGSAFGVKPVSVAGGSVKTRDELELIFDLVCERRP